MKNLFLSSSFTDVAPLLPVLTGEKLKGKKVTLIPTAAVHEKVNFYVKSGKRALEELGLLVEELEIGTATQGDIWNKLQNNDYIYVTGGNTFFLLQELKRTRVDKIIIEQINAGKVYIGESAGSIIMAPDIEYVMDMDDSSSAIGLEDYTALGVIPFYPLPHYTNYPFKKTVEKIISKYESALALKPISNSQVILVRDSDIEIISV